MMPSGNPQEFPHIEAVKTIDPDRILKDSIAEVTITLEGKGGMILTPVDVALVMDRSGSMLGKKIEDAKEAAITFLDYNDEKDRLALISYSDTVDASELIYMDEEGKNVMIANIELMRARGSTNIYDALVTALDILLVSPRVNAPPVIVLLTDGLHNWPTTLPDSAFQELTEDAKNQGIIIYTIGLGGDVNGNRLKLIAETTGGTYYFAPTSEDLERIYEEIGGKLAFAGTNIEVTETVPSYVTYNDDATKPPTTEQSGGNLILTWTIGHLRIGEEWEVTYTVNTKLAVEVDDQIVQTKVEYITAEASSAIINLPPGLIYHDIKISNLDIEPSEVLQGEIVNVTVDLENQGIVRDSIEVEVNYDDSIIETQNVELNSGEIKTLEFKWNTSDVEGSVEGTLYNVTVTADPDEKIWETDRTDNQETQSLVIKIEAENIWWLLIIFMIIMIITVGGVAYAKLRQEQVSYECPVCRRPLKYNVNRRQWYCDRCRRYF
jgi:hypothetical protein